MLKAKIIDAFTFIKTLTLYKLVNGFLLRFSFYVSKITGHYWHVGVPESIAIEPGNICNLMCPECPTGNQQLTRFKQFIEPPFVQHILANLAPQLSYVQFFFQGEPLMHPKFVELVKSATQNRVYSVTSTNGHYLTSETCEALISAGLKRLIVSVDGTSPETYKQYRVGGNLETVLNGIENMVRAKKKLKKNYPYLILQMVILKTNEHQITDFKTLAKRLGADEAQLKSAQLSPFKEGHALIPENKKYSRYISISQEHYILNRNSNFKCWRTWHSAVISANGQLIPCCFDKNGLLAYGPIKNEHSVNAVFKSEKATAFRKLVWEKPTHHAICQNCTEGLKCRY